jgi:amino acid permease
MDVGTGLSRAGPVGLLITYSIMGSFQFHLTKSLAPAYWNSNEQAQSVSQVGQVFGYRLPAYCSS